MNKILVSGANGFIGARLCRRLRADGYEVHGLVRASSAIKSDDTYIRHQYGDICDEAGLRKAVTGMEGIVHLAAKVHQMNKQSHDQETEFRRINVQGTMLLAQAAVQAGVKRFVYISSIKAERGELGEDYYGYTKRESEEQLLELGRASGLEVVILRPCLVYGPGVKANFLSLLKAVHAGIPLPLAGIHNKRSFLYVDNCTDAIVKALISDRAVARVLSISDGYDISTPDLVRTMAQVAGIKARLFHIPGFLAFAGKVTGRGAAIERLTGSLTVEVSQAQEVLEWSQPITFYEGIRHTVNWYLQGDKD